MMTMILIMMALVIGAISCNPYIFALGIILYLASLIYEVFK